MNPMKKYQRLTVVFLMLIGIVNYLDRSALSIANTSIQKDMMISPSQMGILLSAFSIAYAFAQLPMGMIIDRLGSKIALGHRPGHFRHGQQLCRLHGPACVTGDWRGADVPVGGQGLVRMVRCQ